MPYDEHRYSDLNLYSNNELRDYIDGLSSSFSGGSGTEGDPYRIEHVVLYNSHILLENINLYVIFKHIFYASFSGYISTPITINNCEHISFSDVDISYGDGDHTYISIKDSSNISINNFYNSHSGSIFNIDVENSVDIYLSNFGMSKSITCNINNVNNIYLSEINGNDLSKINITDSTNTLIELSNFEYINLTRCQTYSITSSQIFKTINLNNADYGIIESNQFLYAGVENGTIYVNNSIYLQCRYNDIDHQLYNTYAPHYVYGESLSHASFYDVFYASDSVFDVKNLYNITIGGVYNSDYPRFFEYNGTYNINNIEFKYFTSTKEFEFKNINNIAFNSALIYNNVNITNCVIKSITSCTFHSLYIDHIPSISPILISNNYFGSTIDDDAKALYIKDVLYTERVQISSNTFINCKNGLYLEYVKNFVISSNTFDSENSINITKSSDLEIKDNQIGRVLYNSRGQISYTTNIQYGIAISNDTESINCENINITNNKFFENNKYYIVLGINSLNCLIYNNQFSQNYLKILKVKDDGNNQWFYDQIGNYWSDYRIKHASAIIIDDYWSESYLIEGSNFAEDQYPLLYNYIFKASLLNSTTIPYNTLETDQYLSWSIEKISPEEISYKVIYTDSEQLEHIVLPITKITAISTYTITAKINTLFDNEANNNIPIGVHNFTLIVSDNSGYITSKLNSLITVINTPPEIISAEYILMPVDDPDDVSFTIIDQNFDVDSYYTIKINGGFIGSEYTRQHYIHNQQITIASNDVLYNIGKYFVEVILNDGLGILVSYYFTIEIVSSFNNIAPKINKIPNLSYKEGTLGNFITTEITDFSASASARYELYINDELYITKKWISGESFSLNIDGLLVDEEQTSKTFECKLIAYDGMNLLSDAGSQSELTSEINFNIIVYSDYNDPPIINTNNNAVYNIDKSENTSIAFQWIITDSISYYTLYTILIDDVVVEYKQFRVGVPIDYTLNTQELSEGTHIIKIIADDGLGKETIITHKINITKSLIWWEITLIAVGSAIGIIAIIYLIIRASKSKKITSKDVIATKIIKK